MDTTIVAQMTDHGLARMNSRESTDTIKGTINRLFARMALGAQDATAFAKSAREARAKLPR